MGTQLAAVAPLVIPLNPECTELEGYIPSTSGNSAAAHWLRLTGIAPHTGTLSHARVELDQPTRDALGPSIELVQLRLKESKNAASFIVELKNLMVQSTLHPPTSLRTPLFYQTIKRDLETLGWDKVVTLSDDLSSLTLESVDAAHRRHVLTLSLPPSFPLRPPVVTSTDLPIALNLPKSSPLYYSLVDILRQFDGVLEQCQRLWDDLDDLDANTWVIEPTAPTRSVTYRRIALGRHVTVGIKIDAGIGSAGPPDLAFMGADSTVEELLHTVRVNRHKWDAESRSLRENLQVILGGIQLPTRGGGGCEGGGGGWGSGADDVVADCAICYNYRRPLEENDAVMKEGEGEGEKEEEKEQGEVPEVNCSNTMCGKPFHRRCLREWLGADASTRVSFDTMFGACPYCSSPIAVKSTR